MSRRREEEEEDGEEEGGKRRAGEREAGRLSLTLSLSTLLQLSPAFPSLSPPSSLAPSLSHPSPSCSPAKKRGRMRTQEWSMRWRRRGGTIRGFTRWWRTWRRWGGGRQQQQEQQEVNKTEKKERKKMKDAVEGRGRDEKRRRKMTQEIRRKMKHQSTL